MQYQHSSAVIAIYTIGKKSAVKALCLVPYD
jgi:hypothetical protein